jgi:hypothetical protein
VLGPELPAAPQHRQSHGLGAARGEPVAAHARCTPVHARLGSSSCYKYR